MPSSLTIKDSTTGLLQSLYKRQQGCKQGKVTKNTMNYLEKSEVIAENYRCTPVLLDCLA